MTKNNIGYIHSIETMGLVDGPGVRFVVFMQGCKLRCLFCHNPDTWKLNAGLESTPEELISKIERYMPYFEDGGGVTFSGGEPLVQSDFLLETLKLCKSKNIHTCIDTAGVGGNNIKEILKYTDLVLFDIKAFTESEYESLVGLKIKESLNFLDICQQMNKKMWLRQVIIPGINDNEDYINRLSNFIKPLHNIEKIELLPYELFGVHKYKELNIPYRLEETPAMNKEKCDKLYKLLLNNIK